MSLRSLLFVPGDSERKLARAAGACADALIIDLEDGVGDDRKSAARALARDFLQRRDPDLHSELWVRINALSSAEACGDVQAIMPAAPHGLMIPKVENPADLSRFSKDLDTLEARAGLPVGYVRLIAIMETPRAVLRVSEYAHVEIERLRGITWGAEDLSAALCFPSVKRGWDFAMRTARAQCLIAAKAIEVEAVETVNTDLNDQESLRAACLEARRAGFTGKLAIHPDQVAIINAAFTPSADELTYARQIVDAFNSAAFRDVGAATLNGRMIDIVHLRAAQRLLNTESEK